MLALAVLLVLSAVGAEDAGGATHPDLISQLRDLLWALLLLGAVVFAGLLWFFLIRRGVRDRTEAIRRRETAFEQHYRDLFENAHDVVITHDLEGRILWLNPSGERLLGYPQREAAQLRLLDLLDDQGRGEYAALLEDLRRGTPAGELELELETRDRRRVAVRLHLSLQRPPGRSPRIQAIAWDVTARREAEAALRDSESRLRRLIEDRDRLARDLHDGIIQSVYALGLNAAECRKLVRDQPGDAEQRLDQIIDGLNRVIRDIRNFIGEIESASLRGTEFRATLESIAAALGTTPDAQFQITVDPEAANALEPDAALHLVQIAREAMTNSVRHGRSRKIRVALELMDQAIRLEIEDDGAGFDPAIRSETGRGLANIRARALEVRGQCDIVAQPGQGVKLTVTVPRAEARGAPGVVPELERGGGFSAAGEDARGPAVGR